MIILSMNKIFEYEEIDTNRFTHLNKTHGLLKRGYYTCMVCVSDVPMEFQIFENQFYTGMDFCWYKSNAQFIWFVDLNSWTENLI